MIWGFVLRGLDPGLVQRLSEVARGRAGELRVSYVVDDVVVVEALDDYTVADILLEVLREAGEPIQWRDLKAIMAGVCGEDRLRRIIYSLKAEGKVAELRGTRYALPEHVPVEEIDRVKNVRVLSKILGEKRIHLREVD
jgi:hypothetical protein